MNTDTIFTAGIATLACLAVGMAGTYATTHLVMDGNKYAAQKKWEDAVVDCLNKTTTPIIASTDANIPPFKIWADRAANRWLGDGILVAASTEDTRGDCANRKGSERCSFDALNYIYTTDGKAPAVQADLASTIDRTALQRTIGMHYTMCVAKAGPVFK